MLPSSPSMAEQVAVAASAFQRQITGHTPQSATVVLCDDTLVVTLHEALSPAEKTLARNRDGAQQVQEFHRQLFADSCEPLRQEIHRITGVKVREAMVEVETSTGALVQVFTAGTTVQVFLLASRVSSESWSGNEPDHSKRLQGG